MDISIKELELEKCGIIDKNKKLTMFGCLVLISTIVGVSNYVLKELCKTLKK